MGYTPIKTLIVDDSVVYRSQIKAALQQFPQVEVVGVASNGKIALESLKTKEVDLLLLDLEMPELDGPGVLKELSNEKINFKILVFSSITKRASEASLEALRLGATDFIPKPDGSQMNSGEPWKVIKDLLAPRIQALFPEVFERSSSHSVLELRQRSNLVILETFRPKIVVIGSSTGGPNVLEKIFSNLHGQLICPILITQHMPPVFTASLAERIGRISGIKSSEAKDGEIIQNQIYVAPGNYHMRVALRNGVETIKLDQDEQINFVRPAVDPLFTTAAKAYGKNCLGIVLTGMGSDGKVGAENIKNHSGMVLIQSESSCVVFGMPGAVKQAGAYDRIMSPDEIIQTLGEKVLYKTLSVGG